MRKEGATYNNRFQLISTLSEKTKVEPSCKEIPRFLMRGKNSSWHSVGLLNRTFVVDGHPIIVERIAARASHLTSVPQKTLQQVKWWSHFGSSRHFLTVRHECN